MKRVSAVLCLLLAAAVPASAAPIVFTADMSGPAEQPPNASPGVGSATVTIDVVTHLLRVQATFSGLLGTTTASHIHTPTPAPLSGAAGVATTTPTFAGFPLGVTSGTFDSTLNTLDASTYNPAFVTANGGTVATAEAALFSGIISGRSYLNIHTTSFTGGEIRGFLVPAAVPEPASLTLVGMALAGLVMRRRLR